MPVGAVPAVGIETFPSPRAGVWPAAADPVVAAGAAGASTGAKAAWPACQQKLNAQHTSVQCRRMARSDRT
jgi:hypothetical protein